MFPTPRKIRTLRVPSYQMVLQGSPTVPKRRESQLFHTGERPASAAGSSAFLTPLLWADVTATIRRKKRQKNREKKLRQKAKKTGVRAWVSVCVTLCDSLCDSLCGTGCLGSPRAGPSSSTSSQLR